MKTYKELAAHSRQYLNKNILTTLNQKSLENFQLSEKVDLPFFVIYYSNDELCFSYSLSGLSLNSKTGEYYDPRLITEEKFVINKDLYSACNLIKSEIGEKTLGVLKRYERMTLQIFYIPESTNKPFSIDYFSLKDCGYKFIISENYKQSKSFTLDFIHAFNSECSDKSKIVFNPYYYADLKRAIFNNSSLITIEDSETLGGQQLDDEIYNAIKKTIKSIKFPMQDVCPTQKLEAVYLTLDRGKDFKNKGLSKRFTYSFFPIDESVQDKITSDAVEDNLSRLPYELLISNFGSYIIDNRNKINQIGSNDAESYIEKVLTIIEDYCSKTDFSFLNNLGLNHFDLRPPKLKYYMSPINIDYIDEHFNLSKTFITQLKKSELTESITCTLINFLFSGLNNAAWTIYLNQDIKNALQEVFSKLRFKTA